MKVKEESQKVGLKAQHSEDEDHGIWGNSGNSVSAFIFLGSKITADGDCSHGINRCLILGRKAMANLNSILESRDITFADKGPSSQSYGFSSSHVQM